MADESLTRRFATRQWMAFLLSIIVTTLWRYMNWCTGAEGLNAVKWTIGLYMAGDAVEAFKSISSSLATKAAIEKGVTK